MNILGMGAFEVLVVLVVAFIVLGPQRMVDAARLFGKASRELRRIADELPDLTLDSEPVEPAARRPIAQTRDPGAGVSDAPRQEESSPDDGGPVEFRPPREPRSRGSAEGGSG